MKKIAETLSKTRESLGISLEDASRDLKIRYRYLLALEEGELTEISHHVYLIGYLRTYANYLGLDSEDLVAYLHAYQNDRKQIAGMNEPLIEDSKPGLITIIISLLAVIVVFFVWQKITHSDKLFTEDSPIKLEIDNSDSYNSSDLQIPYNWLDIHNSQELENYLYINEILHCQQEYHFAPLPPHKQAKLPIINSSHHNICNLFFPIP